MDTILIVPGYKGSDEEHWQTWLQKQYRVSARITGINYDQPVLNDWVQSIQEYLRHQQHPVSIVAHSFGCLAVASALDHPDFTDIVKTLLLVAPASPERFTAKGHQQYFPALPTITPMIPKSSLGVIGMLVASRNDPWLPFQEAIELARQWELLFFDNGAVGHINPESGYGPWPECKFLLDSLRLMASC